MLNVQDCISGGVSKLLLLEAKERVMDLEVDVLFFWKRYRYWPLSILVGGCQMLVLQIKVLDGFRYGVFFR